MTFQEELRPETESTLQWAVQHKLSPAILTGDHSVGRLADEKYHGVNSYPKLLPEEKMEHIRLQQNQGEKVIMVGDGINDAPALTLANIGIAMGCGADISRDSADICLLSNDLSKIPWTLDFSKAVSKTIRQNLIWAVSYNTIGILLAAFGLLNPILAALAMLISSLFVIGNSLKLSHFPSTSSAEIDDNTNLPTPAELKGMQSPLELQGEKVR